MTPNSNTAADALTSLRVEGFSFGYTKKKQVLHEISFQVMPNEIVGVIGANGAGKSTLISAIADNTRHKAISLAGQQTERQPLVTAFDEPKLYSYLSGRHFIRYILALNGLDAPFPESIVAGFQLGPRLDELVRSYSFGMKRKVYLTTCLAVPCTFLQMDEPTNGLDALSVIFLKDYLHQLCQSGTGVLLASHDIGFLEAVCDKVLILKEGRICGTFDHGDERGLEQVYLELVR